jgi:membrane associated rhomboid family serine protease/Flp pilus assembly protein TadD
MTEEHTSFDEIAETRAEGPRERNQSLPYVTLVLFVVNLLVWVAVLLSSRPGRIEEVLWGGSSPTALIAYGAKVNTLIQQGEYWRLVSPMFLHVNAIHLLINGYNLLFLGGFIERLYGHRRFLIIYVMSGLCGNLASYLFNPDMMVGASTALFGLFGATMVFWWKHRPWMAPQFRQRMGNNLLVLLVVNLLMGLLFPIIDTYGHLGGLVGGIAIGLMAESRLMGAPGREREWLPVPLALATIVALLGYGLFGTARSLAAQPRAATARQASRDSAAQTISLLRRAIAEHPEIPELRRQLALALIQAQQWDDAAQVLRDLRRFSPKDPQLLEYATMTAVAGKNWSEAADLIEERLRQPPSLRDVFFPRARVELLDLLAQVHVSARDYPSAARAYERALNLLPDDLVLLAKLALVQTQTGDYQKAVAAYQKALRRRPDDATLLNNLAYLYADNLKTNLEEAARMAERATALEPRNGTFWDTRAWVYYRQQRFEDAYASQREAVLLEPKIPEVRFHMGAIHEARGDLAAARAEYQRALALDAQFAPARAALRRLQGTLGIARDPRPVSP